MEKSETLKYIGNLSQLGGCRHYILSEGSARGMRATDIDTGSGLQYTVLPDRAMDISLASFKGINLVYLTCNGETHPAFYEPEGIGWLRTFAAGLLTTCGLTYLPVRMKVSNLVFMEGFRQLPPDNSLTYQTGMGRIILLK
jgi:hypothetical protein